MFPGLRHSAGRLRRGKRPALALLLVLAQCLSAFGVFVRGSESVRPCGCKVNGPLQACCCGTGSCCVTPAPAPPPEPERCPKCRAKQSAKPVAVTWTAAVNARQCHGES